MWSAPTKSPSYGRGSCHNRELVPLRLSLKNLDRVAQKLGCVLYELEGEAVPFCRVDEAEGLVVLGRSLDGIDHATHALER